MSFAMQNPSRLFLFGYMFIETWSIRGGVTKQKNWKKNWTFFHSSGWMYNLSTKELSKYWAKGTWWKQKLVLLLQVGSWQTEPIINVLHVSDHFLNPFFCDLYHFQNPWFEFWSPAINRRMWLKVKQLKPKKNEEKLIIVEWETSAVKTLEFF